MAPIPCVVRDAHGQLRAVLRATHDAIVDSYTLDLVRPPERFFGQSRGSDAPAPLLAHVDQFRLEALRTPAARAVATLGAGEPLVARTRRLQEALRAWFLVAEDPQRRLDVRAVETLSHQASLVQHVLTTPALSRVLIADEVGLGKTVEAGLILQSLLAREPQLRILYLAPARLVDNVLEEFRRLELPFRRWAAGSAEARWTQASSDPLIVASIHRAAHDAHREACAQTTWDVIVVDEAHHLSAWGPGGGDPVRKYELVRELVKRQPANGRLLLLTGTPHQGHADRFQNLLRLLARDGESPGQLAGRVIYRTKDDVRDWEGRPLFPRREVRPAIVIDPGPAFDRWLQHIHAHFEPQHAGSAASQRASGWKCGMALQWASSSVEAGLGFLVRQVLRAGGAESHASMQGALARLRPYRGGSAEEPLGQLCARIRTELDLPPIDADDADDGASDPDLEGLYALLAEGVRLLEHDGTKKWEALHERVLSQAGEEKVVLFAQPIETVDVLARWLERRYGAPVARIVGGQSAEERQAQIEKFRSPGGARFLVSSRAGGEGINLQVARRLVHVDVPWNPMELEQRVGRVHRFGSRARILVDTLVTKSSREAHMFEVARAKLAEIARDVVPPEQLEALFSRVMSLVPPEELAELLVGGATGPLRQQEATAVSELVSRGFRDWQCFHETYSGRQRELRTASAGAAGWDDLESLVELELKGERRLDFVEPGFQLVGDDVVSITRQARVLTIEGVPFALGATAGLPITDGSGRRATPLGLNSPQVVELLRRRAESLEEGGVGVVRRTEASGLPSGPCVVLLAARQLFELRRDGAVREQVVQLCAMVVAGAGATEVEATARGGLVRELLAAREVHAPAPHAALLERAQEQEARWLAELRRPTQEEQRAGLRPALWPIGAVIVE